jgi:hypothetical protein
VQNPYFPGLTAHDVHTLSGEQRKLLNRVVMHAKTGSMLVLTGLIPKFEPMIRHNKLSALAMSKILLSLADEFKMNPDYAPLVVALCRIVATHSPNAGLRVQAAMDMIAFGARIRDAVAGIEAILAAPGCIPGDPDIKRMAALEAYRWLT